MSIDSIKEAEARASFEGCNTDDLEALVRQTPPCPEREQALLELVARYKNSYLDAVAMQVPAKPGNKDQVADRLQGVQSNLDEQLNKTANSVDKVITDLIADTEKVTQDAVQQAKDRLGNLGKRLGSRFRKDAS